MPAAVLLSPFVVVPCWLALVVSPPSFLAGCLQLLTFDGSLTGVFCVLPLTIRALLVLLRFRMSYRVVGGFLGVFCVLTSVLAFLLYWLLGGVEFVPSHSWDVL